MPPATPLTGTDTLHPNSEQSNFPQPLYSEAQKDYINYRRSRMIAARDIRDTRHQEFDDMTFLQWYDVQKKMDDQYVAPRRNKTDTSINLGTVRDKDTYLVEYATKFDFEPVAQVYDEDDSMLEELAETGEDFVRKSKMIEMYPDKAKRIYRSMVAFGTAMVEDLWFERWEIEKRIGATKKDWTEKKVKTYDGCQAKLWDLRKCYFGDIRKYFMNGPQGQPYFFTVEYESFDYVKSIFEDWDMWKYVHNSIVPTPEAQTATVYAPWWTLRPITMNYVEIIRYYDPIANEYALTLNGIDMLPIMETKTKSPDGGEKTLISGFPLTEISPSGAIPFAKYDLEPMHDFTYSKGQPAKMRVLAEVENMWMKLLINMAKQKAKPAMGNAAGRNFDESITDPGNIVNDIRDGDLFPILPNFQGATPQDFSFFELIKKELDKNSVERSFQGMKDTSGAGPQPQDETATGDMNNLKAQSLKVAALFDGIISGENQLNWLRTYNISRNWTKPIDIEVDTFNKAVQMKYRKVSLPSEVDGGQKAVKRIIFTKSPPSGKTKLEASQKIHQQEMDYSEENGGVETRIVYLDPDMYASMKLNWFYTCVPVPNGSDPLSYMMFAKQIGDATTFFGPQSLNVKRLKHRFSSLTGNDFDTWFLSEQELQQAQTQAAMANGGAPNGQPGQTPPSPGAGLPPNNAGIGARATAGTIMR